MDNRLRRYIGLALCFFSMGAAAAAGGGSGQVKSITVKETGYILIGLTGNHDNPVGCERASIVAIASDHVAKQEIMTVALTALTLQKPFSFWLTECYHAYGTSYPLGVTATMQR